LDELGPDAFRKRYGQHFVVFTASGLIDDAAEFVNTASREVSALLAGHAHEIDAHPITKERAAVGRDKRCDIPVNHRRVSSLHAVFTRGGGLLFLADVGSKNGTKLNGVTLTPHQPVPVDAGDLIEFGPVRATVWGLDDLAAAAHQSH
jgi:hypothetical protein